MEERTMAVTFTHHNIQLADGTWTCPKFGPVGDNHVATSAKRVLQTVFPGEKRSIRVADLGCLEGGYAVAFARMGFSVLGIEVREANFAACRHVKERVNLANLEFVRDDAWNLGRYGPFDAVFCCGLLYHIDRPKLFLEKVSAATSKLLLLQTHFSTELLNAGFKLSELDTNEGLQGRWYREFSNEREFQERESSLLASWDNRRSFWVRRDHLLQTIQEVGFDTVFEQFDHLGREMAKAMTEGTYKTQERGTFVGIKTGIKQEAGARS